MTDFENHLDFEKTISRRKCLVTGHTGFTGGWLSTWLLGLNADVSGISLAPETKPSLYESLGLEGLMSSHICDITRFEDVRQTFAQEQPEIVFHLAAQPIVGRAFDNPLETFASNVMGTANVLEAARLEPSVKAVVCVTTDKVYDQREWPWAYRENDALGGKDPYSASKSAAEMVARAYQGTLAERGNGVAIATARGGNIIGGGDWSEKRIVPDFARAHSGGTPLVLRNPSATRPWQHVIALCHGYLVLADRLLSEDAETAIAGWNFGPRGGDARSVGDLIALMQTHWSGPDVEYETGGFPEAHNLQVDSSKAIADLGWRPHLKFEDTVRLTADWYRGFYDDPANASAMTKAQIAYYRDILNAGR